MASLQRSAQRAVRLKAEIDASSETAAVPSKFPVDFVGLQPRSPGGGVPLTGALEALFRVSFGPWNDHDGRLTVTRSYIKVMEYLYATGAEACGCSLYLRLCVYLLKLHMTAQSGLMSFVSFYAMCIGPADWRSLICCYESL